MRYDFICNIAIYADDTTLYSKFDQASDQWQQLELTSELESDPQDTVDWGRKWLLDFNAGKTQLFFLASLKTLVLLMWKWMGLFLRKNHLLRYWSWLFSKLDWESYIMSIAKTASKKIRALIFSMKFLSPNVILYL